MDIINVEAITDPRWLLDTYAPDLYILVKTAPDLAGLAKLSETVLTALQEAVRDRYAELAPAAQIRCGDAADEGW